MGSCANVQMDLATRIHLASQTKITNSLVVSDLGPIRSLNSQRAQINKGLLLW